MVIPVLNTARVLMALGILFSATTFSRAADATPGAPLPEHWEVRHVYSASDQILGIPRALTVIAIGEPLPEIKGLSSSAELRVEAGAVADTEVNHRPARAFRFLLTALRAGEIKIPPVILTGQDQMQIIPAQPLTVTEPRPTDLIQLNVAAARATAYPGQPVAITVTWKTTIPLSAIKALHLLIPQFANPACTTLAANDPKNDDSKNALGLPVGETRMIGTWNEVLEGTKSTTTVTLVGRISVKNSGTINFDRAILQCAVKKGELATIAQRKAKGLWRGPAYPSYFNNDFFDQHLGEGDLEHIYCSTAVEPLTIEDFPVPPPANFTGLIGRPTLTLSSPLTTARVGDPVQITCTIAHPDADVVTLPALSTMTSFTSNYRVIDNRTPMLRTATGASFNQTIWPLHPDVAFIPPLIVAYFDPLEGRFREAESNPLPLKVAESELPTARDGQTSDGKPLRNPIVEKAGGLRHNVWGEALLTPVPLAQRAPELAQMLWWLLVALPPLAVGGRWLWRRWCAQRQRTLPQRLAASAHRRCVSALRQLPAQAAPHLIKPLITRYLAERFRLAHAQLDFADAAGPMTAAGIPAATLQQLAQWFAGHDRARFAAATPTPLTVSEAIALINLVEEAAP